MVERGPLAVDVLDRPTRSTGLAPSAAPTRPLLDDGRGHGAVEIGVLGALEVRRLGHVVAVRRGHPRRLLCALVAARGRPIATDTLVDQLWSERLPAHPSNALQIQIAYLRRVLGGTAVAPIVTRPEGYVLDVARVDVDVDRFEGSLARARSSAEAGTLDGLHAAVESYVNSLALWRGPAYGDVAGLGFADAEIVRLEELRLSAREERCEVLLALGRTSEAVAELSAMVEAHPWRERGQELLVLALYRSGRQADALRAFSRARRSLVEELGVEPGPALRELERRVLAHDRRLEWSPPAGSPERAGSLRAVRTAAPSDPAPESAAVSPTKPMASTTLIGRDHEVARLMELVSERRLVTLTGPGGAGKTRLALEVAASQTTRPVRLVDLAPVEGADDLAVALLAAVTIGATAETDPEVAILAALGDETCLLVLDTCERVQPALAPLVGRLLDAAPGLTVLATSRRPLAVDGELAWPVPPLAVPTDGSDPRRAAAFELFVERTRELRPDFTVADDDVATVAEICRTLDGLPLAIELAAAQMDALSASAVLAQLTERRSFAARDMGPDRHRTLGATTDWSVGLLGDADRDMLFRLAVLAPTFDIDAAVHIAGGGDPSSVARLVTLVRTSLVAQTADNRYRLLDTVRTHLLSTDHDEGRLAQTRYRHATYYAELAAKAHVQIRTASQGPWMRRLDDDHANIRAALNWCFGPGGDEQLGARLAADIAWAWTLQGNLIESQAALERASSVDTDPLVQAKVLLGIGLLAAPLGDHDRARVACLRSAELGRSVGDDPTVASAYLTLGVAQWAMGDLAAAASTHDEAAALFDDHGDVWGATICRILRARTARDAGDPERAEALLDLAIDDAKHTGDAHVIGLAYEQYARLSLTRGLFHRAEVAASACLEHNERLGYPEGISAALTLSAQVRMAASDPEGARAMQRQALAVASAIGHTGGMCAGVEAIAEIDAATGDRRQAARLLLVAQRARARRNLPLAPVDEQRLSALRDRLQAELGPGWEDVTRVVPLTSLTEVVRSTLDGG